MKNRPILIGLPGSGKSYLAKKASKFFKVPFQDMDSIFLEKHSLTPGKYIIENGDEEFRNKEREILDQLLENKSTDIIAAGGGTPCYFDNMDFMLEKGDPIFLDIERPILIDRLEKEKDLRPWLAYGADLSLVLDQLYSKRRPFYEKARITITSPEVEDQIEILKPYCT